MSSTNLEISEKKFGEYGIVDYLKKPVFFEDIDKRTNEILRRRWFWKRRKNGMNKTKHNNEKSVLTAKYGR